ncbi:MAG TPA: cytochrome c [Thermomicrobiaceae bacterium]|nr:cytochrome c [Thermomicrobiaceae bacterium]
MVARRIVGMLLLGGVLLVFAGCGGGQFGAARPTPSPTPATQPGATETTGQLAVRGQILFQQFHCNTCHTVDGTRAAGPTMKGLYGSTVVLETGQTVVADSQYLRESILNPDAQIPKGYGPQVMSLAMGDIGSQVQADDNVDALVAYIESLK